MKFEANGEYYSSFIQVQMALMTVYYKMPYKHHALSIQGVITKGALVHDSFSHRENLCLILYALESNTSNKKQLRSLDSYFRKLHCGSPNWEVQQIKPSVRNRAEKELETLNDYLDKLNNDDSDVNLEDYVSSIFDDQMTQWNQLPLDVSSGSQTNDEKELKNFRMLRSMDGQRHSKNLPQALDQYDEISDLYLIGILASINIAVFLFQIASPVKNAEFELLSLPLLYGAKINDLIMVGEWWRLLTPMFLVQD